MKKRVPKDLIKVIWKEGFSFEDRVFRFLTSKNWKVIPNRFFRMHGDAILHDYDFLAYKRESINGHDLTTFLLIECKYNPYLSVFYVRNSQSSSYIFKHNIGSETSKKFTFDDIREVVTDDLKQYQSMLFPSEEVFGYQTFKKDSKVKKERKLRDLEKKPYSR